MKPPTLLRRGLPLAVLFLCALNVQAITIFLQEQGALTGAIVGGGGTLTITPLATDHWKVHVQDPRIGNPLNPNFSLAFIEPETVLGYTAYNNIQVLTVAPGTVTFDVLSDEISPYSTIVPNNGTVPIQNTDVEVISIRFLDFADSVPEPGSATLLALAGAVSIGWRRRVAAIAKSRS